MLFWVEMEACFFLQFIFHCIQSVHARACSLLQGRQQYWPCRKSGWLYPQLQLAAEGITCHLNISSALKIRCCFNLIISASFFGLYCLMYSLIPLLASPLTIFSLNQAQSLISSWYVILKILFLALKYISGLSLHPILSKARKPLWASELLLASILFLDRLAELEVRLAECPL